MNHEQYKILNMKENEILQKAINQFTELTGACMKIFNNQLINNGIEVSEACIELKTGAQQAKFRVHIKNEIRVELLPGILNKVNQKPDEWLLVCRYIPKSMKEKLKNQGINYLETAGNCFIRKDGLFFYINDRAVTTERQPKEGKLWKQAGIKFLFAILLQPELLNEPYRKIAEITGVALGNIGSFIVELKKEGFLKDGLGKKDPMLFIENKEVLRNKWIGLFNAVLKPKLKQGRFRFTDKQMMFEWKLLPDTDFFWGGEPAGALLTGHLHPEIFTLYTHQPKMKIMQQLKLVPDPAGNVEILDTFWHKELNYQQGKVPPLLAYADLVNSLDSRNRETAERIKQQYLDTTD
jgi:hypothetical protein